MGERQEARGKIEGAQAQRATTQRIDCGCGA